MTVTLPASQVREGDRVLQDGWSEPVTRRGVGDGAMFQFHFGEVGFLALPADAEVTVLRESAA